ncbi:MULTISPECIES: hypothetical protein [unclassified Pseudonocardia]|uniref:hypothetical protein n=1 Tax=unclassified Pseudonocardia TaxID=2619320 RepID=UPI0001FFEB7B|nr:hypothetical protein [Pseudonocardia sp. Ae707_Ps1]OLM17985.1 hypothetical protein Ae707Ps1_2244 [Pseudonocardia sp. Ae707_Ps1]
MAKKGFKVNKRDIDRAAREVSKQWRRSAAKHIMPISLDVEPGNAPVAPGGSINNFYGPVNNSGQMAVGISGPVDQSRWQGDAPIANADGLRECLVLLRDQLDGLGLDEDSRAAVEESTTEVENELDDDEPDPGKIRQIVGRVQQLITTGAAAGTLTKLIVDGLGAALG